MKTYQLLVLKPSFVTEVQTYVRLLYDFTQSIEKTKDLLTEKEFRSMMWGAFKRYWMHKREELPKDFMEIIPENLRESTCTVVSKQARNELTLDNGTTVPMFNYGGECIDAGQIPHILGVVGTTPIVYNGEGKTPPKDDKKDFFEMMRKFNKN